MCLVDLSDLYCTHFTITHHTHKMGEYSSVIAPLSVCWQLAPKHVSKFWSQNLKTREFWKT